MAEIGDIIAVVAVILAVVIAIYSTTLKDAIGELPLLLIEVGLFVVVIFIAVAGQRLSTG